MPAYVYAIRAYACTSRCAHVCAAVRQMVRVRAGSCGPSFPASPNPAESGDGHSPRLQKRLGGRPSRCFNSRSRRDLVRSSTSSILLRQLNSPHPLRLTGPRRLPTGHVGVRVVKPRAVDCPALLLLLLLRRRAPPLEVPLTALASHHCSTAARPLHSQSHTNLRGCLARSLSSRSWTPSAPYLSPQRASEYCSR